MTLRNLLRIGTIAAVAALPFAASAQNEEAVRAKCVADARAAYPDDIRYEHQVARKELYITCMQKAGYAP
jgi:hypothetical protein